MSKKKITEKIEEKFHNIVNHFAPTMKEKIVEVSLSAKDNIFRDVINSLKKWGMVGVCVAPLLCTRRNGENAIPFLDSDRAINIIYNEIHVVNNYKGGKS